MDAREIAHAWLHSEDDWPMEAMTREGRQCLASAYLDATTPPPDADLDALVARLDKMVEPTGWFSGLMADDIEGSIDAITRLRTANADAHEDNEALNASLTVERAAREAAEARCAAHQLTDSGECVYAKLHREARADNAALLHTFDLWITDMGNGLATLGQSYMWFSELAEQAHPGAPLLAELTALRAVAEAANDYVLDETSPRAIPLLRARAALDRLAARETGGGTLVRDE